MSDNPAPDALLLIAPGCPHCPGVLQALGELVKEGSVGRLEVINLASHPEAGERHGVRSVPWLRLGPFELEGLRSAGELRRWAARAGTREGLAEYLAELIRDGRLARVIELIREDTARLDAIADLLADPEAELHVRIGIGALLEDLAGEPMLERLLPALCEMSRAEDPGRRNDACYYLGLTGSAAARPCLSARRDDPDAEVREAAEEALDRLPPAG